MPLSRSRRATGPQPKSKKKQLAPVPPEPEEGHPDAVPIVLRLADGTRVKRRFLRTDRVEVRARA